MSSREQNQRETEGFWTGVHYPGWGDTGTLVWPHSGVTYLVLGALPGVLGMCFSFSMSKVCLGNSITINTEMA